MLKRLFVLTSTVLFAPHPPTQAPADREVTIREVVYSVAPTRTDSKPLVMDLYVPRGPIRGAVVLAHGGAFATGSRKLDENIAYGNALAGRGFLTAAITYRLHKDAPRVDGWASRYADAVRRSPLAPIREALSQYGPEWPDAVAASAVDLASAVRWLRGHAGEFGIDPTRIAVFGASAGAISAITVAYAMDDYGARPPEVAAVVDLRGLMLPPDTGNPIRREDPPLMILHGEIDTRVPPDLAAALFAAAKQAGLNVEYLSAPGYGHDLGGAALLQLQTPDGSRVVDRIETFLASAFAGGRKGTAGIRERLTPAAAGRVSGAQPGGRDDDRSAFRSEIVQAVDNLIESVDRDTEPVESLYGISRRALLLHDFADEQRTDWSYWPRRRGGLPLRYMTARQRTRTQAVLAALLSSKGYLQVNHVMMLEEILSQLETTGLSRGVEDYTVAVFGLPDDVEPWGVRFEGHHVSMNVTFAADALSVTPSFIGSAPATIDSGPRAGFNPLRFEEQAAFALLHSLSDEQRRAAILSDEPPADILSSPFRLERARWDRWRTALQQEGVSASTFSPAQVDRLRRLLVEITGAYRREIAAEYLDAIDLATLSFAWMGGSEVGQPHYFRVQGVEFVFELDAAQDGGNHVHTVWRDRADEFGAAALQRHYQRHRH